MKTKVSVLKVLFYMMVGSLFIGCSYSRVSIDLSQPPAWEVARGKTQAQRVKESQKRYYIYYGKKLNQFMDELPLQKKGGTVFLGDSITDQFPLNAAFKDQNVINYGIGGDRIDGLRERLDICVQAVQPSSIYIMIGTNDILIPLKEKYPTYKDLAVSYKAMLDEIRFCAPKAEIKLFSVLPFGQSFAWHNEDSIALNKQIHQIAEEENLEYIDLHADFIDESGELMPRETVDGIHLNLTGYYRWLEKILNRKDYFEAVCNLSEMWNETHVDSMAFDRINPATTKYPGGRGENELVVYTSAYSKKSTGTNRWGREATISNGRVVKRQKADSQIPEDGFVVSGHGPAAKWITSNLLLGTPLAVKDGAIRIIPENEETLTSEKYRDYLMERIFGMIYPAFEKFGKKSNELNELKKNLFELLDMDTSYEDAPAQLNAISARIQKINAGLCEN